VSDEVSLDGVDALDELLLDGLELGGVALEPLLELGELGLGLVLSDPELEPLEDEGLVLLPMDEEPELELDPEGEVMPREAPVLESGPLLQPYRLPTATAIGRTMTAVFFKILICRAPLTMEKREDCDL
jgi:hypothetical protein